MKKLILGTVLFTIGLTAGAQQTKIGVRAGVNFANYKASGAGADLVNKAGIDAAFLAEFTVSRTFSVQPEIGFTSFGTRFKMDQGKATYTQQYIVLPLLAKFNTTEGLSVFAGPQAGILLSATGKSSASTEKQDLKEFFKSSDFFAVAGVEYLLRKDIAVGVRYHHGLTRIDRQEEVSVHNRGLSISVSYKFGVGRR